MFIKYPEDLSANMEPVQFLACQNIHRGGEMSAGFCQSMEGTDANTITENKAHRARVSLTNNTLFAPFYIMHMICHMNKFLKSTHSKSFSSKHFYIRQISSACYLDG